MADDTIPISTWGAMKDAIAKRIDPSMAIDHRTILNDPYAMVKWRDMLEITAAGQSPAVNYAGTDCESLKKAIMMRMRGSLNFQHWHPVFVAAKQRVVVFVIHKDEPAIVEDDYELFPSDAFITKLRLMLG